VLFSGDVEVAQPVDWCRSAGYFLEVFEVVRPFSTFVRRRFIFLICFL
jgi:hypothetical protein